LDNIWIVKPGENTNRGKGIKVCNSVEQIKEYIEEKEGKKGRTFIIQK